MPGESALYTIVYMVYYTLCMVFTVYHSKYGILYTVQFTVYHSICGILYTVETVYHSIYGIL